MIITRTENHPFCNLRKPSDTVAMVLTQSDPRKKHTFYKYGHISGSRRSPDIILIALHMKVDD